MKNHYSAIIPVIQNLKENKAPIFYLICILGFLNNSLSVELLFFTVYFNVNNQAPVFFVGLKCLFDPT